MVQLTQGTRDDRLYVSWCSVIIDSCNNCNRFVLATGSFQTFLKFLRFFTVLEYAQLPVIFTDIEAYVLSNDICNGLEMYWTTTTSVPKLLSSVG